MNLIPPERIPSKKRIRERICTHFAMFLMLLMVTQPSFSQRNKKIDGLEELSKRYPPNRISTALPSSPIPVSKLTSNGSFSDSGGGKHDWTITRAHALKWDGKAYLPIGQSIVPKSFSNNRPDAWDADVQRLDKLKSIGIQDIIISPSGSLTEVPIHSLQRLIDYLEVNGFTYGLEFGKGIGRSIFGTVIKPNSYRFSDKNSLSATWNVTGSEKNLYIITSSSEDSKILKINEVETIDGIATASLENVNSDRIVALLYPHKTIDPNSQGGLPDLWNEFDNYRDKLLEYFAGLKLGKGFRFFLDPLASRMCLAGETDYLVPSSSNFLLEWEGYLARRYPNIDEAKIAWGLDNSEPFTHKSLSHLIPLWANAKGVPYLYDNQLHSPPTRVSNASKSRWWEDFLTCRNASISYYMNAMAQVLKHEVADVPVVYTWTHTHPIFWNNSRDSGYDGLCVSAGSAHLEARTLGPAYSEAEQSVRTMWCLGTGLGYSESRDNQTSGLKTASLPANSSEVSIKSPLSKIDLFTSMDSLRRFGFKGFFSEDPGEGSSIRTTQSSTGTTEWLKDYGARINGVVNAAEYLPTVLYYPQSSPGPGRTGIVPGTRDALWLSSFANGETVDWWPAFMGYQIQRGSGDKDQDLVLVSLQGKRLVHFSIVGPSDRTPDTKVILANSADGRPISIKITNKSTFEMIVDESPVILHTDGQKLMAQEAVETVLTQLTALFDLATKQKLPALEAERFAMDRAKASFRQRDFATSYLFGRGTLDELTALAQPYIWMEGELPRVHTFTEIAANTEAANGGYLRLSTPNPPSRYGYGVHYMFEVPRDGSYYVWLAGSVPGADTSAIHWKINSEPIKDPAARAPVGPLYLGERFGWTLLGNVNLQKGSGQQLAIYVDEKAVYPPLYNYSIDAILITSQPFHPNGTVRPLPVDIDSFSITRPKKTK